MATPKGEPVKVLFGDWLCEEADDNCDNGDDGLQKEGGKWREWTLDRMSGLESGSPEPHSGGLTENSRMKRIIPFIKKL